MKFNLVACILLYLADSTLESELIALFSPGRRPLLLGTLITLCPSIFSLTGSERDAQPTTPGLKPDQGTPSQATVCPDRRQGLLGLLHLIPPRKRQQLLDQVCLGRVLLLTLLNKGTLYLGVQPPSSLGRQIHL